MIPKQYLVLKIDVIFGRVPILRLTFTLTPSHQWFDDKGSFHFPLQDIEEFSFVTQLAGLTDHLSVAMRLAVSTGEEEP